MPITESLQIENDKRGYQEVFGLRGTRIKEALINEVWLIAQISLSVARVGCSEDICNQQVFIKECIYKRISAKRFLIHEENGKV